MNDRNPADLPLKTMRSKSGSERSGIARQDNEGGPALQSPDEEDGLAATLAYLGIIAVPTTRFEWGGYRYTNAGDAIAAAKRAAK